MLTSIVTRVVNCLVVMYLTLICCSIEDDIVPLKQRKPCPTEEVEAEIQNLLERASESKMGPYFEFE